MEIKKKVFSRFFTTKGLNGTGLGLAICKQLVDLHNGEISVSSKEKEGSVFTVVLPMEP